jgi:hypothetical protein
MHEAAYENPAEYPAIYGGDECGAGVRGKQSPSMPSIMPRFLKRGSSLFPVPVLVPYIIYWRIKQKMRHGLFPQDDISERNSTESRSDLSFEGLRPGVCPGVRPGVRPEVRLRIHGRMYSSFGKRRLSTPQRSDHRHWPL